MNNERTTTGGPGAPPLPDPRLCALEPLVGPLDHHGEAAGDTTYEWMEATC